MIREYRHKSNVSSAKNNKNNDFISLINNNFNNSYFAIPNSSKNSTKDMKGRSNLGSHKSSSNINVYNIGVKNVYVDNKSVNVYAGQNIFQDFPDNISSYSRKSSENNPNNLYINRKKNKKGTYNKIHNINIDKKGNLGYKITSGEQNQSFKFNYPNIRKDIFGSVIEHNGKQKISFADNPLVKKSMNKSKSCPDINNDNNNVKIDGVVCDKNSKYYDPFAEVILIQSYKELNKKNVYGDKPRTRSSVAKDTELICCGTYCNIF